MVAEITFFFKLDKDVMIGLVKLYVSAIPFQEVQSALHDESNVPSLKSHKRKNIHSTAGNVSLHFPYNVN